MDTTLHPFGLLPSFACMSRGGITGWSFCLRCTQDHQQKGDESSKVHCSERWRKTPRKSDQRSDWANIAANEITGSIYIISKWFKMNILCMIVLQLWLINVWNTFRPFSRMRSEGSRFTWGSGGEAVFAKFCVCDRNRSQPFATVRNRSQPLAVVP